MGWGRVGWGGDRPKSGVGGRPPSSGLRSPHHFVLAIFVSFLQAVKGLTVSDAVRNKIIAAVAAAAAKKAPRAVSKQYIIDDGDGAQAADAEQSMSRG